MEPYEYRLPQAAVSAGLRASQSTLAGYHAHQMEKEPALGRPRPVPANWSFILGLVVMLVLSGLCWFGFAHFALRWVR
jgi:hypothetical protein